MEFKKLDSIYNLINESRFEELMCYDKESINIVKELKFPDISLEINNDPEFSKTFKNTRDYATLYRDNIVKKFKLCALTNVNPYLCEAAHIFPYSDCNKNEKHDINNGILLSCNMHKAFDNNYFTIDEKTCRIVLLYNNIKKHHFKIDDFEFINNKYISTLDNKESKYYLCKRNKKLNNI
jgi:predicted restriction endonuclease